MLIASRLIRDLSAGAVCAVIAVPNILNCGAILAQPIGAAYIAAGIGSAFAASIIVSILRAVLFAEPLLLSATGASYSTMVASVLVGAGLSLDATTLDPSHRAAMLMTLCFLCTIISGLIQLGLGVARMGVFVKFIPYPVVAGFVNGFAVLLMLAQFPAMLGYHGWAPIAELFRGGAHDPIPFGAAGIGLATCVITILISSFQRIAAPALWGLCIGTALYWICLTLFPPISFGEVIGAIPTSIPITPQFDSIATVIRSEVLLEFLPQLAATSVVLALISSLNSLLSISAADAVVGTRHDSNRELILQGTGNIVSGLFGGMPTSGSQSYTQNALQSGARGALTHVAYAGSLVLFALLFGTVFGLVPVPVVAAVVVAFTFSQLDGWSRGLIMQLNRHETGRRKHELIGDIVQVLAVTLTILFFGILPALFAGMVLAFLIFVRDASHNVIRKTINGRFLRSRTTRPEELRRKLESLMSKVELVEVQGPVFFGSTEQLASHLELASLNARVVILDFKYVTTVDSSGAIALARLKKALARRNTLLYLSCLSEDSPAWSSLHANGLESFIEEERVFETNDAVLLAAETLLLAESGLVSLENSDVPIADFDILNGVSQADIATFSTLLHREKFDEGETIVREGADGDSMFLLAVGYVTVSRRVGGRAIRYAGYKAGVHFGEMGMLTGRVRAADVIASSTAICYRLDRKDFLALCESHPDVGQRILLNIALSLSDLVTSLSDMVRELEG